MGFSIFNEKRNKFTTVPVTPRGQLTPGNIYVSSMVQLSRGDLLAATAMGLVLIKKTGKGFQAKVFNTGPVASQSTAAIEMDPGDIWFTCPSYGVYGLMHAKLVGDSLVLREKFFQGINLRCMHRDELERNIIWVASSKGLIKFNTLNKRFVVYDEAQGMANSYLYGILEDARHNLWLSSNGGLIYFDRKNHFFQNYTVNDGLQSNEFNTGSFYKGASGTFYFGGVKGFNWFGSIPVNKESYKPGVAITSILVNDQPFEKDSSFLSNRTISLSYDQNNLAFVFAALDFTRPQANKIQYQLEEWDRQWITTAIKTVRYPNLPPGRYLLKVKASGPGEIWSDQQSVIIIIKAPFWKRWWFYLIILITALILVVLVTRAIAQKNLRKRLQQLEKQRAVESERDRISKDMHDEIGSGLTHIALMSELIQKGERDGEELKRNVGTISLSARKLVQSMSEIIWALNPQNDTLDGLLAYTREQAQGYFEPFDIEFGIYFPDEVPHVKLSNAQKRNLFLVIKEALHNALKHAGATQIILLMAMDKECMWFTVKDNGRGLSDKIRAGANGLRNMEKRMVDIKGSCEIKTGSSGTVTTFLLPLKELME
jgi:signal transduction histidine kinase